MACICHFVLFSCPAQSLLWVYLVWVHSQCSLEVLSLLFCSSLGCRNLALNRIFLLSLRGRHVFTLWGASLCPLYVCMPPYIHMPHTFVHPCTLGCPHMFKHPLYVPMLPCASVSSRGYLHMIWECRRPSICLDTTLICLDVSPYVQHPPHFCMLPSTSVCSKGYLHVKWGYTHMCEVWGASAHLSGF